MATNSVINIHLFGQEIGRIGMNEDKRQSSFQYNPEFLASNRLQHIFPRTGIIRPTEHVQLFNQYNNETFRGLAPQFADSLPDLFGSIIFKAWLDGRGRRDISVLEQLAYVGRRGMGAIEYSPVIEIPKQVSINLNDIIEVLREVLDLKKSTQQKSLDDQALINIFKIGSSAGGVRPKILISEHKESGKVIPGDLEYSDQYNHYLVKLGINDETAYPREIVEYCYYLLTKSIGIRMMDSKLIDHKHFATLRYDRQHGEKIHCLTASGMTGWDYKDPSVSSYENLFKLCSFLKIPHAQMEELYRRMIFNIIYGNGDDHMKNHSFIYDRNKDGWELSPAYDITYATNPLINISSINRALSINGKRKNITLTDVLKIAEQFTIKNPRGVIRDIQGQEGQLIQLFNSCNVPKPISEQIIKNLSKLI